MRNKGELITIFLAILYYLFLILKDYKKTKWGFIVLNYQTVEFIKIVEKSPFITLPYNFTKVVDEKGVVCRYES